MSSSCVVIEEIQLFFFPLSSSSFFFLFFFFFFLFFSVPHSLLIRHIVYALFRGEQCQATWSPCISDGTRHVSIKRPTEVVIGSSSLKLMIPTPCSSELQGCWLAGALVNVCLNKSSGVRSGLLRSLVVPGPWPAGTNLHTFWTGSVRNSLIVKVSRQKE